MTSSDLPVALLVEDDIDVRNLMARMLTFQGFSVLEAGNGAEGLSALHAHPEVAVLVTDLVMPGVDGYELLEKVRDSNFDVPAVAMTATLSLSEEQEKRLGAAPLLYKPFTLESLIAAIRAARFGQPDFSYEVEPDRGIVSMRTAAMPSVEEKIATIHRVWADPIYRRGFSIIVDRRGYDEVPSVDDMRAFMAYLGAHDLRVDHASSWAFVADRPSVWRFYRSVEPAAAQKGVVMRAFQDYDDAVQWAAEEQQRRTG